MAEHFRKECKHGVLVSQCRCPAAGKSVIVVDCPSQCLKSSEITTSDRLAVRIYLDSEGSTVLPRRIRNVLQKLL